MESTDTTACQSIKDGNEEPVHQAVQAHYSQYQADGTHLQDDATYGNSSSDEDEVDDSHLFSSFVDRTVVELFEGANEGGEEFDETVQEEQETLLEDVRDSQNPPHSATHDTLSEATR